MYDDVLEVAKMYMGPAAQRFMSRQVTVHLGVQEAQLEVKHVEELGELCYKNSRMFMPEDKALQFGEKIKLLGKFS
jgi:hypothetical protein